MAAAAATRGIAVTQVSYGNDPERSPMALLASRAAGAMVEFSGDLDRESMETLGADLVERYQLQGESARLIPRGGASVVGACGFAAAAGELARQLDALGIRECTIVVPVGSGGSIAGFLAGAAIAGRSWQIVGVSVSRPPDVLRPLIQQYATETLAELNGSGTLPTWQLYDGRGQGFGVLDPDERRFSLHLSATTGLVVDPTYNAKALKWLAEAVDPGGPVVYWSTGGILGAMDLLQPDSR
jgi:D-cysteine desulfhydrase